MPHSFYKIWIHAIWSTKNREMLIHPKIEHTLHQFIKEQFKEQGCPVSIINGMPDHIHCLFLMNYNRSISDIIKQIKGSSSHFINQNNFLPFKFSWQTGYAAFSVSESGVESVYKYIKNQKTHHQNKSSKSEYDQFLELHGLSTV
jgi:putative transposase